jgi:hypothetical protein
LTINEKDMSAEMQWYAEKRAEKAIKALQRNRLEAEYAVNREEALTKVLKMIPAGGSIACGDSVTLHQIGFIDWLKQQKDHEVFNPFFVEYSDYNDHALFNDVRFNIARKAFTANVFVTGSNAVTLNGEIVNMDGHGNRVAPMLFGPNRVIIVAGYNKIVKDIDAAMTWIQEYVAPINMKRHFEKHGLKFLENLPCVKTGTCHHCNSENKGCMYTTIIGGWSQDPKSPNQYPTHIIIVGEVLGI